MSPIKDVYYDVLKRQYEIEFEDGTFKYVPAEDLSNVKARRSIMCGCKKSVADRFESEGTEAITPEEKQLISGVLYTCVLALVGCLGPVGLFYDKVPLNTLALMVLSGLVGGILIGAILFLRDFIFENDLFDKRD